MKIVFENGCATVKLADGRTAYIYENMSGYYRRMMYTLAIEEEIIYTRAGMDKIRQYLYRLI